MLYKEREKTSVYEKYFINIHVVKRNNLVVKSLGVYIILKITDLTIKLPLCIYLFL